VVAAAVITLALDTSAVNDKPRPPGKSHGARKSACIATSPESGPELHLPTARDQPPDRETGSGPAAI